ncbi:histidine phosphatase family protein [Candidatus Kaiserbacteria bacterium]|nr:histidine phosphatase family protein [Candidatus Kaiserbacteria bacterium]
MKTIYFVRHGQSENNAARRYNTLDTPLSEKGKAQAATIGERLTKLPVEVLVASDMLRAQQTAHIISERVGLPIETASYFRERVSASSILGKKRDDPTTVEAVRQIEENFHIPGWRYEDGENFEDLKERAMNGLQYLAQRDEKNIAVVTHGFFMYVIAAALIFGSELTSVECLHIIDGLEELENTSLTVAKLRETKKERSRSKWRLAVWNDHAHLG